MAWVILELHGRSADDKFLAVMGLNEHHGEWYNATSRPIVVTQVTAAEGDSVVVPPYCSLRRISESDSWSTWRLTLGESTAPLCSSARDYEAICRSLQRSSV